MGIEFGKYFLYVSRLEPENNAHVVIENYAKLPPEVRSKIPLVIVGKAPYSDDYQQSLKELAVEGVIFAGGLYGDTYRLLQLGAFSYIQATEVGGTHPALVEAMGFANCVIAYGTPENIEVLGSCGLIYQEKSQLIDLMEKVIEDSSLRSQMRGAAFSRAKQTYSWDKIVQDYINMFRETLDK